MKCSVKNCSNASSRTTKSRGITFHRFPKEPSHRTAWVEALGVNDSELKDNGTVCSEHFRNEDFCMTKQGRKIQDGAVPVVTQICKICLTLDSKLCHIGLLKLEKIYEDVTGIPVSENELIGNLPTHLCWECAARLKSAAHFKNKALLADVLMRDLLKVEQCIKVQDIISIHNKYNNLRSSLVTQQICHNKDLSHTRQAEELDITLNIKIESDDNDLLLTEVSIKDEEMIIDDMEHVELVPSRVKDGTEYPLDDFAQSGDGDDNNTSVFFEDKKVNTGDIQPSDGHVDGAEWIEEFTPYLEETDVQKSEDDDNMVLSKLISIKSENVEIEELSSDTEMVEINKNEVVKKCKTPRLKKENPGTKRKRAQKKPYDKWAVPFDESVIKITKFTEDEMMQEVLQRKHSAAYKDAKFKCDVCYQTFWSQERQIRHALKHSELFGAYQCKICKRRFKTKTALVDHKSRTHKAEYSCNRCPFVSRCRSYALDHIKFHVGTKFKCSRCAIEFDQKSVLFSHIREKHNSDAVCELCGQTFISKHGVQLHRNRRHPLAKDDIALQGPYCIECDVKFHSQKAFDRHLKLSLRHFTSETDLTSMCNDPLVNSGHLVAIKPKAARGPDQPVDCKQHGVTRPNPRAKTRDVKMGKGILYRLAPKVSSVKQNN